MKIVRAIFLFCCLFGLCGCSNISSDKYRTITEGGLLGCAGGYITAKIFGSSDKTAMKTCAAGAAVGTAYGSHVARKKEQYASQNDYLEAVLADAEQVTTSTNTLNKQLNEELVAIENEIKSVGDLSNTIETENLKLTSLKNNVTTAIASAKQGIARVEQEIEIQKTILANESASAPMNFLVSSKENIAAMETEKETLKTVLSQLQLIDKRRIY